jgi:hypothetical protein
MYLNKAGKVNAQFTIQIKRAPTDIQDAVGVRIKELGMKPMRLATACKPEQSRRKKLAVGFDRIRAKLILDLLKEIAIEKAKAEDWLKIVSTCEVHYLKKLKDLESYSASR